MSFDSSCFHGEVRRGGTLPVSILCWTICGVPKSPSERENTKQVLDEVFVISRIIKVEVRVISQSRRRRLITLTETLIILDITKTESNNCFIMHCTKKNGHDIEWNW